MTHIALTRLACTSLQRTGRGLLADRTEADETADEALDIETPKTEFEDADFAKESAAEAAAEAEEPDLGYSMRGPMGQPRPGSRRLLFGGLSSGISSGGTGTATAGNYPPAVRQTGTPTCYCTNSRNYPNQGRTGIPLDSAADPGGGRSGIMPVPGSDGHEAHGG